MFSVRKRHTYHANNGQSMAVAKRHRSMHSIWSARLNQRLGQSETARHQWVLPWQSEAGMGTMAATCERETTSRRWPWYIPPIRHLPQRVHQSISPSKYTQLTSLWHKPTELAHSFLFCSCVCFCLCGPFNCISFHKFSRQLSAFSLCCSGLISSLLVLSSVYLFMKVSFSPDIIPSGWLGSKHQLTN